MKLLFIRVMEKLGLLRYFNFHFRAIINGKNIIIPMKGRAGLENLFLGEPWFTTLIKTLINDFNDQDHFVDVGVNVGQTLLKVKTLEPGINYIGFEPNSTCISYVADLIRVNYFNNVSIYPFGLSDQDGMLKLFADNAYASGASVIENFRKTYHVEYVLNVPVVRGDNFLKDFEGNIKLIKIDVEGFESDVLIGMQQTVKRYKPIIICEVLPVYSENNKPRLERQKSLEEFLRGQDYGIYLIEEKTAKLRKISEIGIHGDMGRTNYVFCHESRENSLAELII